MARSFSVKRQTGFTTIAMICFIVLYAPMIMLAIYSFNAGTNLAIWEGFSLRWYEKAFSNTDVQSAALRSLQIASVAAILATIFGGFIYYAARMVFGEPRKPVVGRDARPASLLILGLLLAALLLLGVWLVRTITQPVRELTAAAHLVAQGGLGHQVFAVTRRAFAPKGGRPSGERRIRTFEGVANRFTVCPL